MASPVRALSSHYETLQVSPRASVDEIVGAFASHMRTARIRPDITVAHLAQLSVAYETLRDPAKRKAYDASIGLEPEPEAAPINSSSFIGAPVIARLNRIAASLPNAPAPSQAEAQSEPRVAQFIAASLREPVNHAQPTECVPTPQVVPQPSPETSDVPLVSDDASVEIEEGRLSIGRTGATLAAGMIGVAILAFTAALPDRNPDRLPTEVAQPEPGLTVPVPPATPADKGFEVQPVAGTTTTTATAGALPKPLERSQVSAPARKMPPAQWVSVNPPQAQEGISEQPKTDPLAPQVVAQQPSEASPAAETPAVATDLAPASATAAAMPLSNATIARTIERIGYGCGRVVSAAGVDGAAGVFNITCSSGDTYRASPVRGRYHFRRTGH